MSDALRDTVAAAQAGDRDAAASLLAEHLVPLEAFVRLRADRMIVERESVHDLVQSACREALADLGEFKDRGEREFRNWLLLLATRKILDRKKHHRRAARDVAREAPRGESTGPDRLVQEYARIASPSRVASAREELARIESAIGRLPEDQRDAVVYVKLLDLTYEVVAERMGRTAPAVRGLVARGLAALAEHLE